MGAILEFFVEIIFRGIIVHVIGLYTRYYFFKLIGKKKDLKYLSGDKVINDKINSVQQPFYNAIVGIITFCALNFSIAYMVFS
ncbi:hypothetical protein [Gaetbulibacter sp. PBL-D1]|uniref:hypothetical protein n=1 Tax=Gaetbulibacter sp. PBL-D1 TaxID=3422594 RepID=UPI003D2EE980